MGKRITVTADGVKTEYVRDPKPDEAVLAADPALRELFDLQGDDEPEPEVESRTIDGKTYYFRKLDMGGLIRTQLEASPSRNFVFDFDSDEGFQLAGAAVLRSVLVKGLDDLSPYFASVETADKWVHSRNRKVMRLAKNLFLVAIVINPDIFPKAEAGETRSTTSESEVVTDSLEESMTTTEPE